MCRITSCASSSSTRACWKSASVSSAAIDGARSYAQAPAMRRLLLIAAVCLAGVLPADAAYRDAYNDPLVFGMTQAQVEAVVQAPLVYLSGARGAERFLVE